MKFGVIRTEKKIGITDGIAEKGIGKYFYYMGTYEDVVHFAKNNNLTETVKHTDITINNLNRFIFNNIHFYNGLMQKAKSFNGYKYNATMKSGDISVGERNIFPEILLRCRNLEDDMIDVQVFIKNTIVCNYIHNILGI